MLKHVYNYQQQRNAAAVRSDGHHQRIAGTPVTRSPPLYDSSPLIQSSPGNMPNAVATLPRQSGRREPNSKSATPSSLSTISSSSSSADESTCGRSSSGMSSRDGRLAQPQQHAITEYLTERETVNHFRFDRCKKPSRMATIKIHVNVLNPAVTYTTLFVPTETTAKEMVKLLLTKFHMRNRDSNLFYITMETTIQDRDTGGLPKLTLMKIDDNERPLELNSCMDLQGITIRFHLCSQPGGLVKVRNECLMAGARYKGLVISPKTTAAEVIEMLVNGQNLSMQSAIHSSASSADSGIDGGNSSSGSGCGSSDDGSVAGPAMCVEKPEDFDLYEICQFRKNNRPMRSDAMPLLMQSVWSNPQYYSFELRRKAKPLSLALQDAIVKAQSKIPPEHIFYDKFGNKYMSQEAERYWPTLLEYPHNNNNNSNEKANSSEDIKVVAGESAEAQRNCDTLPASVRKRDAASKLKSAQRPKSSVFVGELSSAQKGKSAFRAFGSSDDELIKPEVQKRSSSPTLFSWMALKNTMKSLKSVTTSKPKKVELDEIKRVAEVRAEEKRQQTTMPLFAKFRRASATPPPRSDSPTNSVDELRRPSSSSSGSCIYLGDGNRSSMCKKCRKTSIARDLERRPVSPVYVPQVLAMDESQPGAAEWRAKLNDYVNYFYM